MPSIDEITKRLREKGLRVQKVLSRKELVEKLTKTIYLRPTTTFTSDIKKI
ncbi:hypothetical protein ACFFIX_11835 [Metabacillus herbersteinensis]|uniref:Uncharacterized protein n=1 Tax=Metabacillus herbersteinensis TaxID=283816 RepID=A0ABV6GFA5_9BACI